MERPASCGIHGYSCDSLPTDDETDVRPCASRVKGECDAHASSTSGGSIAKLDHGKHENGELDPVSGRLLCTVPLYPMRTIISCAEATRAFHCYAKSTRSDGEMSCHLA